MLNELRTCMCVMSVGSLLFSAQVIAGDKNDDPERKRILENVKTLLREGDSFRAIEFMNGLGEPAAVAGRYSDLVDDFYWREKALPEVVTIARAGIQYCLTEAQGLAEADYAGATDLRGKAKAIAYNLASYTWPGWDEPGIIISQSDLDAGLDAAKLNLRLAIELEKGSEPLSAAQWLLGAQYLAAGAYDEAVKAFDSSRKAAAEGKNREYELLALGYTGMTRILQGAQENQGREQFDEAITGLDRLNTEDAKFLATQLKTVLGVFSKD